MPRKLPTHGQTRRKARAKVHDYDARRGSSAARGYDADWRRFRTWYLSRRPLCELCAARGVTSAAVDLDHIVPIAQGGARLDPDNVQGLCHSCHSRKTVSHDGGFGRKRRGE